MSNNLTDEFEPGSGAVSMPELLFWRFSNPLLAALIGLAMNGLDGAALGLYLGLALMAAPDVIRQMPRWRRKIQKASEPLRSALWSYVPGLLRERIAERRGQ